MIVNERMTSYLHSLDSADSDVITAIREQAQQMNVPIVRPETAALLRVLIRMLQPKNVLEIGTATGYSAVLMGEKLLPGARITTIENYAVRIPIARENIKKAGMEDVITLMEGDAQDVLAGLPAGFDFIFMDAAKGQYIHYLPEVLRILKPGGVLVSDNVLQDGDVIQSRFAVTRRNRTIHSRMREYLWEIKHHPQLETSVLTVGDGMTLSVRLPDKGDNI